MCRFWPALAKIAKSLIKNDQKMTIFDQKSAIFGRFLPARGRPRPALAGQAEGRNTSLRVVFHFKVKISLFKKVKIFTEVENFNF